MILDLLEDLKDHLQHHLHHLVYFLFVISNSRCIVGIYYEAPLTVRTMRMVHLILLSVNHMFLAQNALQSIKLFSFPMFSVTLWCSICTFSIPMGKNFYIIRVQELVRIDHSNIRYIGVLAIMLHSNNHYLQSFDGFNLSVISFYDIYFFCINNAYNLKITSISKIVKISADGRSYHFGVPYH